MLLYVFLLLIGETCNLDSDDSTLPYCDDCCTLEIEQAATTSKLLQRTHITIANYYVGEMCY